MFVIVIVIEEMNVELLWWTIQNYFTVITVFCDNACRKGAETMASKIWVVKVQHLYEQISFLYASYLIMYSVFCWFLSVLNATYWRVKLSDCSVSFLLLQSDLDLILIVHVLLCKWRFFSHFIFTFHFWVWICNI
jgi:hypothetical protein